VGRGRPRLFADKVLISHDVFGSIMRRTLVVNVVQSSDADGYLGLDF